MIEVNIKEKKFKDRVLFRDVQFKINNGVYLLKGENGSGKTTFLKMLNNLDLDYDGEISFAGKDIRNIDKANLRTNYIKVISQKDDLFPFLTVKDLFDTLLVNYDQDDYEEIIKGLNLTKIVEANKKFKRYSGGEKQKIRIAIGLLSNAPVICLDEPDNNLDIQAIEFLGEYILRKNKTFIIVSHTFDSYVDKSDIKLLNINDKKIELTGGEGQDISFNPAHDKVKLNKKVIKKISKQNGLMRGAVYTVIILLLILAVFNTFRLLDHLGTLSRGLEPEFSDNVMLIEPPISNPVRYGIDDDSWYKKHPMYFTEDDKRLLEENDLVEFVEPYYESLGKSFVEGMTIDHEYFIDFDMHGEDLDYARYELPEFRIEYSGSSVNYLNSPKSINSGLPLEYTGPINNKLIGDFPEDNSDEIAINPYLAVYWAQKYNLNNLDDLVGREIEINEKKRSEDEWEYNDSDEKVEKVKYKVSGIFEFIDDQSILFPYSEETSNLINPWNKNDDLTRESALLQFNTQKQRFTIDDIPDLRTLYPGFYVEVKNSDDMKKLTEEIMDYDKYIFLDSNYSRLHTNNFQQMKNYIIKQLLIILIIYLVLIILLIIIINIYIIEVQKIITRLSLLGFDDEEIKKYQRQERSEIFVGILLSTLIVLILGAMFSSFNPTGLMILLGNVVFVNVISYLIILWRTKKKLKDVV